jgi:hypothetical protein
MPRGARLHFLAALTFSGVGFYWTWLIQRPAGPYTYGGLCKPATNGSPILQMFPVTASHLAY